MDRQEIMQAVAEYFGLAPDEETGEYDINSYDWISGCYINRRWLSLEEVVKCIEQMF